MGEYSMYGISERTATCCIEHYAQEYGIKRIIFRLPPVYGYGFYTEIFKEGKPCKTGLQVFIENAKAGKPLEVWGDCKIGRPVIYVKDVVSAIMKSLNKTNASGIYDIATYKLLTLEEEAKDIICVFSQSKIPSKIIYRPDKSNSVKPYNITIFNTENDLGWKPEYTFKEMMIDYKKEERDKRFLSLIRKKRKHLSEY
jgi:UDP-glucose 4-epimerase